MRFSAISIILAICTFCTIMACSGGNRPAGVLSPHEMEDVMHDLHLAQVMDLMAEHEDTARTGATDKVFEKYNLKPEELDSSLAYYSHHVSVLKKIYDNLKKRYAEEADALGIHQIKSSSFSESIDTTDIWMQPRLAVVSSAPLHRLMTFELDADTSYYQRDQYQLEGFIHFLGRNDTDQKNSLSIGMTVVYTNDSIQSVNRTYNSSQKFFVPLHCDSVLDIKSLYGFISIYGKSSQPALLEDIRLLKIHRRNLISKKQREETDSVN